MFVRAGELGVSSAFIFGLVRTGGFGDYGVFPECGYELLRDAAD
jgi:hypothetical protein